MSNLIEDLYTIKHNPFKYSEYIYSFYSKIGEENNNILFFPLIIPLSTYSLLNDKLEHAQFGEKKQSSLWSIFPNKSYFYDLQDRIDEFCDLSQLSFMYCLTNDWLTINTEKLVVKVTETSNCKIIKSASNLGKLMKNYSITEIQSFLGVKLNENNY